MSFSSFPGELVDEIAFYVGDDTVCESNHGSDERERVS